MKKIVCLIACVATVLLLTTSVFATDNQSRGISISFFDKGDVNRDKRINKEDANWLLQYTAGWKVNIEIRNAEADLNADGKIDGLDALTLLQKIS